MIPDLIMNPHAIPSRMTVAQLIACMSAKIGAIDGKFMDGTPFMDYNVRDLPNILKKLGYSPHGTETMYCGITGRKIDAQIFIGPTYYMRLKHMVLDKVHCLTMDHEIFTNTGWKYFNELTDNDRVLSIETDTGNLYWDNIEDKLYYNNENRIMYHIKNDNIDTLITENHKLPYRLENDEENIYRLDTIENIINLDENKIYLIKYTVMGDVETFEVYLKDIKVTTMETDVFCLTMEKGTFYVRRNNLEYMTGNSRSTGPRQALTRQPLEGRARAGGLRIGEMEKDAMEAHGMGQFTKERMMETSDIANFKVCDDCGVLATRVIDKDYYVCHPCNNHTRISSVNMPYACKLLFQELMSINIMPKIKTENDKYD